MRRARRAAARRGRPARRAWRGSRPSTTRSSRAKTGVHERGEPCQRPLRLAARGVPHERAVELAVRSSARRGAARPSDGGDVALGEREARAQLGDEVRVVVDVGVAQRAQPRRGALVVAGGGQVDDVRMPGWRPGLGEAHHRHALPDGVVELFGLDDRQREPEPREQRQLTGRPVATDRREARLARGGRGERAAPDADRPAQDHRRRARRPAGGARARPGRGRGGRAGRRRPSTGWGAGRPGSVRRSA